MGEGWSDFYARALLSTAGEDLNGVYAAGSYVTFCSAPALRIITTTASADSPTR